MEKFFYWGWSFYSMKIEYTYPHNGCSMHEKRKWFKVHALRHIKLSKLSKNFMKFEKDHLHFQTRHAHVDTQTINVNSNNWIENSNIIFFYASISVWVYVCAARFHDMNRNCRDSSIRYTTLLFQKNTTQKKTLRYWYYCQLYYSLHVIIGRIYLLPIKGIWSYINKIPIKDKFLIIFVACLY